MLSTAILLSVLPLPRTDIVLADFEGNDYGNWKIKGAAFGTRPAHGTLQNQMAVTGFVGKGLANSYVGGDGSIGSLTSPTFTIDRPYLNFLVGGGFQPLKACINLIVDGKVVLSSTGASKTPQDTEALQSATWNLAPYKGKKAKIQILDLATGGWGHISIDQIVLSDHPSATPTSALDKPMKPLDVPAPEPLYHEKYRPQFHFSSKSNWLNDPNGLVYYDGLYHLFYQHNPAGIQWGNMTWGHAVSTDLIHWQQRPNAIEPDALGTIYSGSAALDKANSTGFGTPENPPLVAMYTAAGKPFTQGLAYSVDKGKTWTKYSGNPVIQHIVNENRDPRIFWHEPTKKWVMALYLDGEEFAIFGSTNLKEWTELSRLTLPGSSECPELFEIPIEGSHETKWIFFGANYRYLVGTFDGKTFTPEQNPIQGDFGANFYASQTYNNTPDHRRIQIAWMNGQGPYPNMPFNQQMSFPCELNLVRTTNGLRLLRHPIKEIEKLRIRHVSLNQMKSSDIPLKGGLYDIAFKADLSASHSMMLSIGSVDVHIDRDKGEISCLGRTAPVDLSGGTADIRILVDRSSIEIFAQSGIVSMTSYLPSDFASAPITLKEGKLISLDAYELKSAW